MPKIEVEILRTVTITREESATVELNVPKSVIDDGEELDWIDQIMEKRSEERKAGEKAVVKALADADWDVNDEDESTEYDEANNLS
jgi:hypothetical protein